MIPPIRARVLAISAVLVAAAFVLVSAWIRPDSDAFTWRSSTAANGTWRSGRLGQRGPYELIFHTREQKRPWVEIDLGERRQIREIVIKNRIDCCAKRALPLVVSVREDPGSYVEVARQERSFAEWRARFEPRTARFVRLEIPRKATLHLSGVEIR